MLKRYNGILVFIVSIFLITTEGRCRKRPVREIIQHRNCIQKTVINFACEGSCDNRLSNILSAESATQSCQISASQQRFVRLRCFENGDLTQMKSRQIAVSVVTECSCSAITGPSESGSTSQTIADIQRPAHATRRSRFQSLLQRLAMGRHRGRHRSQENLGTWFWRFIIFLRNTGVQKWISTDILTFRTASIHHFL